MSHAAKRFCQDCSPTHQLNHASEKTLGIIQDVLENSVQRIVPKRIDAVLQKVIMGGIFRIMKVTHLLKLQPFSEKLHIHQRTRVVEEEARTRGMDIQAYTFFGQVTNMFVLNTGTSKHEFEGLPGIDPIQTTQDIDDKEAAKKICSDLGVPVPQGQSFSRLKDAVAFAERVGYPVITKPRRGSLSAHTTVNIKNEEELRKGFTCAKQISTSVIVEQYIEGKLYRATTVGPKLIACGHRKPPTMTGDGTRTVRELFAESDNERKQLLLSLGYTLSEIPELSPDRMSVSQDTVLSAGETIPLVWKINLAFGARVIDVTRSVHPDNVALFEKIAKALQEFPTIGIDFIAPDISASWKEQRCGVIELNSLPSIDLHHPPIVTGEFHNIAAALLDYVIPRLTTQRKMRYTNNVN
ncbi:MAG: ATP-grasp domain-containing protein [Candidatus Kerfeldbacteria bacterium]|nr:ATP-grasp domain-containing protein [Candidatus Kerfeldbacteria bacterium]